MKAQPATLADFAADIARRRHVKGYSQLKAEDLARPDNSAKGPAIALATPQEPADTARRKSDAAEAEMRRRLAGRRFSIGEPGDRGGAKPSRPDAPGLGRSSLA